jgi:hypothetical protein
VSVARATGYAERDDALRMVRRQRVNGNRVFHPDLQQHERPKLAPGVPPTRDVIIQERPHGVRPDHAGIETPERVADVERAAPRLFDMRPAPLLTAKNRARRRRNRGGCVPLCGGAHAYAPVSR